MSARIGFHASHEQFAPGELLDYAKAAEAAGFDCIMSSDHFAPWSERQGQSGFAWAWLGAATQATNLPFGIITVPCGWRYHPAITAQAAATLAVMFPGRFAWMALGSGENLNEHVTGAPWPNKGDRDRRLDAGADIVRRLLAGETVSETAPIPTDAARLHTRPDKPPPLIAAALTPQTAGRVAAWADGLLTVNQPREALTKLIEAFRRGGGAGKPLYLQVHLSYAGDDETARASAFDQWRANATSAAVAEALKTPAEFDAAAEHVRPEDLDKHVRISSDPGRQAGWIEEDIAMGFSEIYLHNVGRNQREFIEAFGGTVLGRLS
jgi:coenzyme F420-dependent glucose-6-phosphate dehydrogenase